MNTIKLGNVSKLITKGTTPTTLGSDFVSEGVNFVKSESITDSKYLDSTIFEHITPETNEKMKRSQLKENDLLFSIAGAYLGKVGIVRNVDLPLNTNQAVGIVRLDTEKVNIDYAYYYFTQKSMNSYMNKLSAQSAQPNLNLEMLGNLPIYLPDLPTQKKIADVLSCIDDKIALNNKTNNELENMAKTVYDYWFTQFDFPDANGNPYKTSGGKMEYNQVLKREIPAGWKVKNIQDCCKIIDCLHSKKPDYCFEDENYFLLQLENLIDLKLIDLSNKYYVSKEDYKVWTSKTKVKQGDLVITNAGRVGGVSRIPSYIETGIGRNMTSIRPTDISEYVLCYFFSSTDCDNQIKANTDQGAFFQSLNVKGIKKLNLTIPPKEIQKQFDDLVGKMRLQIETNHQENEELTKLRDYLLPLLMNGQIEVK